VAACRASDHQTAVIRTCLTPVCSGRERLLRFATASSSRGTLSRCRRSRL
jgi:hypothetical protein